MKSFKRFLSESKTWSLQDFSHIMHGADVEALDAPKVSRMRERDLPALIDLLNQYKSGDVPNPVVNDIKYRINNVVERAQSYPASIYAVVRGNHDISGYDSTAMYANQVPGKLKKAEAALAKASTAAEKTFYGWLVPVLRELAPLNDALENLKSRAVKRQPKAPEDLHAKYVAPMASRESGKLVLDALKKMSQAIYDDFAKAYTAELTAQAEALNQMTFDEQRKSRNVLLSLNMWDGYDFGKRTPARLKPTYKARLTTEGKQAADDMQQNFVTKNAKKLASIIERKAKQAGLASEPTILKAKAGVQGAFEGDMRLNFVDGSAFEVRNQVVFKTNQYGTFFLQYPTTFHNVVMPDGTALSMPSEERMNDVFAVA
jgi:hypothetical protein